MDWTLGRLQEIFKEKLPETDEREYKAKAALHSEMSQKEIEAISKDISAMANYPGGVIIYGVEEERAGHLHQAIPKRIQGYEPNEISQAWIEDKLENLVVPRLPAYKVIPISTEQCGTVYVIEIPRSSSAPHQAKDFRYYRRKSARSVAADHLEIEGIRYSGAPIDLGIELYRVGSTGNPITKVDVGIVIRNNGSSVSRGIYLSLFIPEAGKMRLLPCSAYRDPRKTLIDNIEYEGFHIQFGGNHTQEILYPDQPTQAIPIISLDHPNRNPISECEYVDRDIIFEVQNLDGYRRREQRRISDLLALFESLPGFYKR